MVAFQSDDGTITKNVSGNHGILVGSGGSYDKLARSCANSHTAVLSLGGCSCESLPGCVCPDGVVHLIGSNGGTKSIGQKMIEVASVAESLVGANGRHGEPTRACGCSNVVVRASKRHDGFVRAGASHGKPAPASGPSSIAVCADESHGGLVCISGRSGELMRCRGCLVVMMAARCVMSNACLAGAHSVIHNRKIIVDPLQRAQGGLSSPGVPLHQPSWTTVSLLLFESNFENDLSLLKILELFAFSIRDWSKRSLGFDFFVSSLGLVLKLMVL